MFFLWLSVLSVSLLSFVNCSLFCHPFIFMANFNVHTIVNIVFSLFKFSIFKNGVTIMIEIKRNRFEYDNQ